VAHVDKASTYKWIPPNVSEKHSNNNPHIIHVHTRECTQRENRENQTHKTTRVTQPWPLEMVPKFSQKGCLFPNNIVVICQWHINISLRFYSSAVRDQGKKVCAPSYHLLHVISLGLLLLILLQFYITHLVCCLLSWHYRFVSYASRKSHLHDSVDFFVCKVSWTNTRSELSNDINWESNLTLS
jgi:hypothetical protein